jgi:hypothetical protein
MSITEHSHNKILADVRTSLNLNNPNAIQDPVFGLLGNAAAAVSVLLHIAVKLSGLMTISFSRRVWAKSQTQTACNKQRQIKLSQTLKKLVTSTAKYLPCFLEHWREILAKSASPRLLVLQSRLLTPKLPRFLNIK